MNYSIKYNGKDITKSIDLKSCVLTDRFGGLLDSIKLVIGDSDKIWCNNVSKGDEIVIKADGYTTGKMYVARTDCKETTFTIDAVSLKPSKKIIKSKIWRHVRLSEVLKDCANNYGLTLKVYGIKDYYYESLSQIHQTDLEFVSIICLREGYSVKVDDDCLVVFNEYYIENQETSLSISPDDVDSNFSFAHSNICTNSITVSYYDYDIGLIEQTATDNDMLGGSEIINEKVISYEEALRFANGYLRGRNKKYTTAILPMPYNPTISAGTVFNAEGFQEFDGKYVVYEISHDIIREKSNLKIRKILSY